jgi:predicted Zn-dependent protease with MMP-like domain
MPQTQIACPRCRQMITAHVEQLFDITADPGAKQRLLGGVSNHAQCPYCGYEGNLATPVVYHDANKELLITYFPPELNLPVNEQEKLIGPLITQVTNHLPPEKRKAYLLRPQSALTYQSLIEKILEADGITKEMIDDQQKRVNLIQRLLQATTPEVRSEIIKQEGALFDEMFFGLFSRLMEAASASGQQQTVQAFTALQQQILKETEFGKKIQGQVAEVEAAVKSLQEAGQQVTREKLLDIFVNAPNDDRVRALVSLTRQGLDYSFFQILSGRIDRAGGDEKTKLEALRSKLLDYINEVDKQIEEQLKRAQAFLDELLKQPDIVEATKANLDQFNEPVIQVLNAMLHDAQQKNDSEKMARLQQVVEILQQASTPPPELALLEQLLDRDENDFEKVLQEHEKDISPEFINLLGNLVAQIDAQPKDKMSDDDKVTMRKMGKLYSTALKLSMKKNLG